MAANASLRRIRSQLLDTAHEAQTDWLLEAHCGWCHSVRQRSIRSIVHQYGGRHKLMPVVNRLRCTHCNNPPVRLILVHESLERRIALIGNDAGG